MPDEWLKRKFATLKPLGWLAIAGLALFLPGLFWEEGLVRGILVTVGILLVVPWFVLAYLMTIWHWKRRYRGKHSDMWGALLLIETSGWFKIIYWIRHILADWYGEGRYAKEPVEQSRT